MEKKNILLIIISALILITICIKYNINSNIHTEKKDNDIIKFKQEYESLNNTENADKKTYLTLNIDSSNNILYKSDEEIINILEEGTGLIYFGFNTCPWCRNIIEPLFNSTKKSKLENLYYVDIKEIRSVYKVQDKELKKEVRGSKSYYKILELLDNYLEPYIITEDNEDYNTKENRLYAPTVVAVKNGEIVGFHSGTVDSQNDPYKPLNTKQKKELEKIYDNMINKIKSSTCKDKTGC